MTRKSWTKMTAAEREAAVVEACRGEAKTRTDLVNELDINTSLGDLDGVLLSLISVGLLEEGDDGGGFATFRSVSEPGTVVERGPRDGEETRSIPDRLLLCRITPERRAEINAEDAALSREEARLERTIALAKESLKAVHERRMQHAEASESETEMRDVPCVEVLRFESGLAYTRRCDDPAAWPEGTPEDGVVGDPRTLAEADYQPVLPFTADGGLDGEAMSAARDNLPPEAFGVELDPLPPWADAGAKADRVIHGYETEERDEMRCADCNAAFDHGGGRCAKHDRAAQTPAEAFTAESLAGESEAGESEAGESEAGESEAGESVTDSQQARDVAYVQRLFADGAPALPPDAAALGAAARARCKHCGGIGKVPLDLSQTHGGSPCVDCGGSGLAVAAASLMHDAFQAMADCQEAIDRESDISLAVAACSVSKDVISQLADALEREARRADDRGVMLDNTATANATLDREVTRLGQEIAALRDAHARERAGLVGDKAQLAADLASAQAEIELMKPVVEAAAWQYDHGTLGPSLRQAVDEYRSAKGSTR